MERKRFREFLYEPEQVAPITEELVNKGFAVGQQARFASKRSALHSLISKAQNDLAAVTRSSDQSDKINALAAALEILAGAIDYQADLLNHILNVAVADVLLSDDVGNALKKVLVQRR